MAIKGMTCLSKVSQEPLTEYDSVEEAQACAEYINNMYDKDFEPYKCNKCEKWHLSPRNRVTYSRKCSYCTGRDGSMKNLYLSKFDAEKRANIIFKEKGIKLVVYRCPYNDGWHLTKNSQYYKTLF